MSLERPVDDPLGQALLAALHDLVDEPRHQLAVVARIRDQRPRNNLGASWHGVVRLQSDPDHYVPAMTPNFQISSTHEKAVNAHRLRRQAALSCFSVPQARRGDKSARLGLLRRLCSVLRPSLLPIFYATGIQCAADDVVTNAGQVLDPPTAHQHHRVLLEVVPFARNVRRDFHSDWKGAPGRSCAAPNSASWASSS